MFGKGKWQTVLLTLVFCICLGGTAYANEWKQDAGGWWFQMDDGSYLSGGFANIDGKTYHFQDNGYMSIGWIQVNGSWYYMDASGAMLRNGYAPDGSFLNADGVWDGSSGSKQSTASQTSGERNVATLTVDGETQVFYLTSSNRWTSDSVSFVMTGLKNGSQVGPQFKIEIDPTVSSGTTLTTANHDQELELTYYKIPGGTRYLGRSRKYYKSTGRLSSSGGSGEFTCTITTNESAANGIHIAGYFTSTLAKYPLASSQRAETHEVSGSFDLYEGEKVEWAAQKLSDFNKGMREVERELDGSGSSSSSSSGSSSSVSDHTCRTCHGSGECTGCAGRGEKRSSADGKLRDCARCQGSGQCKVCAGTGKVY